MNYTYIMVLNDGTTYTDLAGCAIVEVRVDIHDDEIEELLKGNELPVIRLFDEIPKSCDFK